MGWEGDLPLKKSPIVFGHAVVGVVDEVRDDVERFSIGDRVGAYWLYSSCRECKYCLSGRENYCPETKCTGWDEDRGYAEYATIPVAHALPLDNVQMEDEKAHVPGDCRIRGVQAHGRAADIWINGYSLATAIIGEFAPAAGPNIINSMILTPILLTAYYVLKIAQSKDIELYVSTRSDENIKAARAEGAQWAANAAKEEMPCKLDAAILFPPAGNLVEPILSQLNRGGFLVMAPVSASPIVIENYSENLWGRDIRTLYNLKIADAKAFIALVDQLDLEVGTSVFSFEEVPDALILAKRGKLEEPNGVIKIAGSP